MVRRTLAAGPFLFAWAALHPVEEVTYRLVGEILPPLKTTVILHGADSPFRDSTRSDVSGRFRFDELIQGPYTVVFFVADVGEFRRTVHVGPGSASRRTVRVVLDWAKLIPVDAGARIRQHAVAVWELAVPQKARSEFRKAQDCLRRRNASAARLRLQAAVRLAPQYVDAWNLLGTLAYHARQYQEAEHCYRKALECEPEDYSALVNLGGVLILTGRVEEALPLLKLACSIRPNDPLANAELGVSYGMLGRFCESIECLNKARALDPAHFTGPQLGLARAYFNLGKFREAADVLEEFLHYRPDWFEAAVIRELIVQLRRK